MRKDLDIYIRHNRPRRGRGRYLALVCVVIALAGYLWHAHASTNPALLKAVRGIRPAGGVRLLAFRTDAAHRDRLLAAPGHRPVPLLPDSKLLLEIRMELADANIPTDHVDIRVKNQVVIIRGQVAQAATRNRIEAAVHAVTGIRAVHDGLRVRPPASRP